MQKFFFDTYALIEIAKQNPKYVQYKEGVKILLNKLNIMEYAVFLNREGKSSETQKAFEVLSEFNIDYDDHILLKAAEMKVKFNKEKLSFIDCIGYFIAKREGVKFLTGDEKFKNKENVEFVK